MRAHALALLLASAPVLAQPKDAPVRCLSAGDIAALDAAFAKQHEAVASLTAENTELRKRTVVIAESKQSYTPVVVALVVGLLAGGGVTLWAVRR